jgi:hypothetical protein
MKKMMALLSAAVLFSCSQKGKEAGGNKLETEEANPAYKAAVIKTDIITLQTFEQIPMEMQGCNAIFVADTAYSLPQYVFASNQKNMAFIRLNNKLTELKLAKRTHVDKQTIRELYNAEGMEVEVKIAPAKKTGDNKWTHNGILIIRKDGQQEDINITGKLKCQ